MVEIDGAGRAVWSASFEDQAQHVRPCLNRVRLGFDSPRVELDLAAKPSAWLQGLTSKQSAVRRRTAEAIAALERWGGEAAPTLVPLLKDPDETVRETARRTIAQICPVIPESSRKALKDKDVKVRSEATTHNFLEPRPLQDVEADARKGLLKDEFFSFWMGQLKDDDPDLRWDAANHLGNEDLHTREVVPALIAATRDSSAKVRAVATHALGRFGSDARPAIPALLTCLKDEDAQTRGWAAMALGEIDPQDERVFPVLIEEVQKKDPCWWLASALGRCRSKANIVVPLMVNILDAARRGGKLSPSNSALGEEALLALGKMGPESKAAIPTILAILRDRSINLSCRRDAVYALGEIGPAAKEAIPDLEEAIKASAFQGPVAEEALAKIQGD